MAKVVFSVLRSNALSIKLAFNNAEPNVKMCWFDCRYARWPLPVLWLMMQDHTIVVYGMGELTQKIKIYIYEYRELGERCGAETTQKC